MERAFAFQILSQSVQIKDAINYIGGSFYASNGWQIKIDSCPEIRVASREIYLRGSSKENDLRVDRTWNFSLNLEKDEAISQINSALSEIISFASSYNQRYQVGPKAVLGVYQNNNTTVIGSAPEVETIPVDALSDEGQFEGGWGANRLRHSIPVVTDRYKDN